ncbi:hypothetical protein BV22DRAFT_1022403, partial [Leucogyrophana mollusca]
ESGWCESSVKICLPKEKTKGPLLFANEEGAPEVEINGVYHRSLTDVITSTFQDEAVNTFDMTPFQQFWQVTKAQTVKVFSKVYSSPKMLDTYTEVNALPREPSDDLKRVIASLMLWSDSMHLTSFGNASLWPFYLYFGNQPKYTCGKPTSLACHHVAYILMLPDDLQDIYVLVFAEGWTSNVHTHCKWELFHTIWKLLLNKDFMEVYRHDIVIWCGDGVIWPVFPHFFSYSAHYPEGWAHHLGFDMD